MNRRKLSENQQGFTIIELLFASLTFAFVMLMVLNGFIQIGRLFYKGITTARTQNITREITDSVSRNLQFSAHSPQSPNANVICIGSTRYTYTLHRQLTDSATPAGDQIANVLQRDEVAAGTCPTTTPVDAVEMAGVNMRLSEFTVTCSGDNDRLCDISVKLVYGDRDLLDTPDQATAVCKGGVLGSQFCSASRLTTSVTRRLQ